MQREVPDSNWNELEYLSWGEFRDMAPSILQLEVTRLGTLIAGSPSDSDFHNHLVRARFALKQFIACIEQAEKDTIEATCGAHLQAAIMSMSFQPENLDPDTKKTCSYILDRLNYAHYRIGLIY